MTHNLTTVERILLANAADAKQVLLLDPTVELLQACQERFATVGTYNDDVRSAEADDQLCFDNLSNLSLGPKWDLALGRLPQNLNALDQIASELASVGLSRYIASANTKHMTHNQNAVLEHSFEQVVASLGMGKYRALMASGPKNKMPRVLDRNEVADLDLVLLADGRVFCGAQVDAGTSLLLQTSSLWTTGDACDIGCGNGILTATLSSLGNQVTGIDISLAALRSTLATCEVNKLPEPDLIWGDGVQMLPDESQDLLVSNPPFHVGTAKDSTPSMEFLQDSARVLRPEGELWVVFNAHLPYLDLLRKTFADCQIMRRNSHYVVVRARKCGRHK